MLYGTRSSTNFFGRVPKSDRKNLKTGIDLSSSIMEELKKTTIKQKMAPVTEEVGILQRITIHPENTLKQKFDVFVLLLVGYSVITSLYNSAFTPPTSSIIKTWDWIVEGFFYADFFLNFFQAYKDPNTLKIVTNNLIIAKRYIYGWFIIDLLAIFPFQVMFSGGLMLKLVRLARMPRLIKLLDEARFKRVLVDMDGEAPGIVAIHK